MTADRRSQGRDRLRAAAGRVARRVYPFSRLISQRDELQRRLDQLSVEVARSREPANGARVAQAAERPAHERRAFSHWGEDLIVEFYLANRATGVYVDVGCYHPSLFSNTKLLYDRGWRGINIDPNPFMIAAFNEERPDDTNLNIAIGAEEDVVDLVSFGDWASSNTLSVDFAAHISASQGVQVASRVPTRVRPLADVLREHFDGRRIDFMNVDVESYDLDALRSNDWVCFRPTLLAVEDFAYDFDDPSSSEIHSFLCALDYTLVARCVYTSIYHDGPPDPSLPTPPP